MKNGIIMAAFGQLAYIVQAVLALESVRRYSDLPVTLFTDQPGLPLLKGAGFDQLVELQTETIADVPHPFASPLLARVMSMRRSPYDCTLSLDVDARIRQPQLQTLFEVCRKVDIAIAPCLLDTSRERAMYDLSLIHI